MKPVKKTIKTLMTMESMLSLLGMIVNIPLTIIAKNTSNMIFILGLISLGIIFTFGILTVIRNQKKLDHQSKVISFLFDLKHSRQWGEYLKWDLTYTTEEKKRKEHLRNQFILLALETDKNKSYNEINTILKSMEDEFSTDITDFSH